MDVKSASKVRHQSVASSGHQLASAYGSGNWWNGMRMQQSISWSTLFIFQCLNCRPAFWATLIKRNHSALVRAKSHFIPNSEFSDFERASNYLFRYEGAMTVIRWLLLIQYSSSLQRIVLFMSCRVAGQGDSVVQLQQHTVDGSSTICVIDGIALIAKSKQTINGLPCYAQRTDKSLATSVSHLASLIREL